MASKDFQAVIFTLDKQECGLDISTVQEIIRLPEITKLPSTHNYVLGIINLRGSIIPIIDLKKKFMDNSSEVTKETRVIVVYVDNKKVGLLVDEVSEVVRIDKQLLVPAQDIASVFSDQHIVGVAKFDQRLLIILNAESLLQ